jgi:hypothetical protein
MPPKKGTSTPNKPPENPTWTLDEGEEMRRDINELQAKMDSMESKLDTKMDSMEAKLDTKMDSMESKLDTKMHSMEAKLMDSMEAKLDTKMDSMEAKIMEVMKNFVTEKTPKSENSSHEIHDEDTRKVNQEWRNSNFGLKTNHVPKIDMRKFDGKDPITWILQMEQFFDLHNVPHTQKVRIASLYLEPNQFVWYRWLCSRKSLVTWTIFTEEMIAHYEDTRSNTFFSQLINLKQKGSVTEHIENFQRLNIKVTDIPDEHLIDVFIGTLKDNIQHEVRLWEPKSLENAFKVARNVESKNMAMATRRTYPNIYRENNAPSPKTPQPTRLTPQQLEERKAKGLCFNCDSKYSKGHKCGEKKLFYIDCEEEEEEEQEPSQDENVEAISSEELTPTISCNALAGISTPQTLKIEGYIKKKKVIVLIDSGSTHNFIHCKLAKDLNCFVYPAPEFQVMIADGGTINFSGKCNKINLTMGEYVMNSPMIAIPMGAADVVLGIQWLQSLGTVAFNFQELFMKFSLEGKEIELRGITGKPGKVISSNGMTKLLKKGHQGIIAQLCSLDVQTSKPSIPQDLQRIIDKHSKVFEDIPKGLPPTRNHDHEIHLIPGSVPPNIRPYRYPYAQKSEIERMVEEMLEAGIIRPSQSSYSAPVVMVFKKDSSWRMCPDYRELNKITIKDKFPIPVIDELLDELHGAIYFTKLDLRSGYHQIRMKEEDIPKTAFRTHEGHYEFLVMPFGLTNAPSTFQGLMNSIFKPFLRKFVLVFFDDILIYSKSWEDHVQHVDKVLQLLKEQQLYAKPSKCFFGVKEVEYLGHIVSHEGVKVDPNNIKAMMDWTIPKTLKNLRGFLGLTGYYRKFVRNYGRIAAPLTTLTKKDAFSWTPEATKAFEQLKEVMCTAPVLTTPDFTKTFIVECDASGNGIGVVLMQEGRPLAFESRPLKGRDLHKPIYEKEMMAILHALKKWCPYLIGRHFKVKTDHDSLKYFLEQRLSSEEQQKWVTKILGYDFEIVYKKGKQNVVADALSRKDEDVEAFLCAISIIQPDWIIEARDEWKNDEKVWTLIQRLQQDSSASDTFTWKNDSLWYKDRLYLCKNSQLKQKVLLELHTSLIGGHSGFLKTYHRVKKDFFWDGLKTDVQRFVAECVVCQQNKVETIKTPGILQPLSIPSQRWEEVSMDFITGLPKSEGKSVIMVIVDRLTKYAHFCALSHPFKASTVATAFMETVQKLHGSPKIIVSDRDPIFTGHFWTELFSCLGTQLAHSSSYHPQSDGQTEIVNKCLEGYLRCFVFDKQTQWFKWLPLAEWWYNTSFHTATKMTPFMALYGYHPPSITSSLKEKSKVQAVEDHIENQQQILQILKDNLTMAQNRMKQQADQHSSERSFEVGDWVFLRLQPYKQMSLKQAKKDNKLSPKYYGPYKVLQNIGTMAYKLELPASSRVHPVFHVSCLKKVIGDKIPVQTILP